MYRGLPNTWNRISISHLQNEVLGFIFRNNGTKGFFQGRNRSLHIICDGNLKLWAHPFPSLLSSVQLEATNRSIVFLSWTKILKYMVTQDLPFYRHSIRSIQCLIMPWTTSVLCTTGNRVISDFKPGCRNNSRIPRTNSKNSFLRIYSSRTIPSIKICIRVQTERQNQ